MSAIAAGIGHNGGPKLWLPKFEPWRLLRPLKMFDGQFYPGQPLQFMEGLLTPAIEQRQYITFFSEYTVGAQPSDWTSKYGTGFTALVQTVAGSLGGKALRWTKTSATRQAISWDRIPSAANVEVLIRARAIEAYATTENFVLPYIRGGGSLGAEVGYRGGLSGSNVSTLWTDFATKYVAGTGTQLGTVPGPSPNYTVNTWYWNRFRVNGTTVQTRAWYFGTSEPGTWDVSVTDSAVAAAGWTGLQQVSANPNVEIDFVSVALNGDTALGP